VSRAVSRPRPQLAALGLRERIADGLGAITRTTSGPVYLVLVAVFFACLIAVSIDGGEFLTVDAIREMLVRSVALGIVAVGMTLVILGASLDLSVAYVVSLGSIIGAEVMADSESQIALGVGAVLLFGAVVGLANGLIITKLRVNAFIATLGMALILRGIMESRYQGTVGGIPDGFEKLGYSNIGPIPVSVILLFAVVAIGWFLLRYTRFGNRLYAVGGNEQVAKLSGVRTHRVLIAAHVLCAMAAAITGLFLASRLGAGSPLVGTDGGYDLEAIAAVVLGGTYLLGGRGGVLGTIAGVLILAMLDHTFNQLEVNAFAKDVARGLIIIAAVAAYSIRWRRRRRIQDAAGAAGGGEPAPGGTPALGGVQAR
jgi:ribose transport system permease protein